MRSLRITVAWEWRLGGLALGLSLIGVVAMTSAAATLNPALAWRQAMWLGVGLAAGLLVSRVPYLRWIELAGLFYVASVGLLGFVLLGGAERLGATRWISVFGLSVQPVELAKLASVWWLARYLAGQARPLTGRALVTSFLGIAVPAGCVFLQPDLGSATVLVAIWFGMVWIAGITRRQLAVLAGLAAVLCPIAWHVLKPYQRDRLFAFLDPHADPLGTGYTIIQSQIAIGSGQWWGRGWFAGTQNHLNFLPERHSDFLFSVIGEEWGLLGCLVVVAGFGWLLTRMIRVAQDVSEPHGRLLAVGICAWLGYQALVNMAMVMGLVPVVGIPLPLISYGGTSMVAVWVALGVVQRVRATAGH